MASDKPQLKIGLIGTGFMGKTHVFGFAAAQHVFDLPYELVLHTVADRTAGLAAQGARTLGFARSSGDWRSLIEDTDIDVIDITAPNALHKEMALAAIASGKHVYCEKPLAPSASDAREMADAAEAAGVATQVGFNYLCNPMIALARDLIRSGEIGEIRSYRGIHAEDYMADAQSPFTFRHDPVGCVALSDLGSHALATAEFLTALRAASKPAGSRLDARCSTISRSMAPRERSSLAKSASTSCIFTAPQMPPAGAASAVSKRGRSMIPMASSASRRAISSVSMI